LSSLFLKKSKKFFCGGVLVEYANNVANSGGNVGKEGNFGKREGGSWTKKRRGGGEFERRTLPDRFPPKKFRV